MGGEVPPERSLPDQRAEELASLCFWCPRRIGALVEGGHDPSHRIEPRRVRARPGEPRMGAAALGNRHPALQRLSLDRVRVAHDLLALRPRGRLLLEGQKVRDIKTSRVGTIAKILDSKDGPSAARGVFGY